MRNDGNQSPADQQYLQWRRHVNPLKRCYRSKVGRILTWKVGLIASMLLLLIISMIFRYHPWRILWQPQRNDDEQSMSGIFTMLSSTLSTSSTPSLSQQDMFQELSRLLVPHASIINETIKLADSFRIQENVNVSLYSKENNDGSPKDPWIVFTMGSSNYKDLVHRWVQSIEKLGISNYIILCMDKVLYDEIGRQHGILLHYSFPLNTTAISVDKVRRKGERIKTSQLKSASKAKLKSRDESKMDNVMTQRTLGLLTDNEKTGKFKDNDKVMDDDWSNYDMEMTEGNLDYGDEKAENEVTINKSNELGWNEDMPDSSSLSNMMNPMQFSRVKSSKLARIGRQKAFSVLMAAKHATIYALLSAGWIVTWSDIDCVWVQSCSLLSNQLSYFHNSNPSRKYPVDKKGRMILDSFGRPAKESNDIGSHSQLVEDAITGIRPVDMIAQQGLHPTITSETIGTAICTGFMTLFPTQNSRRLIESIQNTIVHIMLTSNRVTGDQEVMNKIILSMGKQDFKIPGFRKIVYGPSVLPSYMHGQLSHVLDLLGPMRLPRLKSHQRNSSLVRSGRVNLRIGLLPYDYFPRGNAKVLLESGIQGMRERNKLEWETLRKNACIWHMYAEKIMDAKLSAMRGAVIR